MTDTCRCGHPKHHHDAGECWTTAEGHEAFEATSCACSGFSLAGCQHREVKEVHTIGSVTLSACMDCDATWRTP